MSEIPDFLVMTAPAAVESREDVIGRFHARSARLRAPFRFVAPVPVDEDAAALYASIYAACYLNGAALLAELDADELTLVYLAWADAMAGLDADGQKFVLELALKRYSHEVDMRVKDLARAAKEQKLLSARDMALAKQDAIQADVEALETLRNEVEVKRRLILVKIDRLNGQIALEGLRGKEAEMDVLEKDLQVAQADLEVADTLLEVSNLQLRVAEGGLQIAEAEASVLEYQIDVKKAELETQEAELTKVKRDIAVAEFGQAEYETIQKGSERLELAQEKQRTEIAELAWMQKVLAATQGLRAEELALRLQRMGVTREELLAEIQSIKDRKGIPTADAKVSGDIADLERATRELTTSNQTSLYGARYYAAQDKIRAADEAQEILAKASVGTTLMHSIGSA